MNRNDLKKLLKMAAEQQRKSNSIIDKIFIEVMAFSHIYFYLVDNNIKIPGYELKKELNYIDDFPVLELFNFTKEEDLKFINKYTENSKFLELFKEITNKVYNGELTKPPELVELLEEYRNYIILSYK